MNHNADSIREGAVFLVNKPLRWTSFDLVNKIRYHLRKQFGLKKIKVGHAGTLDPLATGLMIICVGKKTKSIESFMGLDKCYDGIFQLGAITPSYDLETKISASAETSHINPEMVQNAIEAFQGEIDQVPPQFSAIKKGGQKAYESARAGKTLKLDPRPVIIHHFQAQLKAEAELHFNICCSKGTYIRSIARDLGESLGCGAFLKKLRRTSIGPYHLKEAWELEELLNALKLS